MINVALCDLILIYTFDLILIYTFSIIIGRILYSTKLVSLQSFSLQSYSSLQDCYLIYDSFFVFLRVVYDSSNCNKDKTYMHCFRCSLSCSTHKKVVFLFIFNLKNRKKLFSNKNNYLLVSSTVKIVYKALNISLVLKLIQKMYSHLFFFFLVISNFY
jgi:hypothetical protein